MAKQSVRSDQIKHALGQKHTKDIFLTECKTGATWTNDGLLKFDALAIKQSWASPCITGYEVKVSRQDFQRDDKWPGYMNFCHRFYFVCPTGLIKEDELPEDVGLIYFNPETGNLYTKRAAKFRVIEINAPMLYYILLSRTESDRHPFFSSRREQLEAFVQDKADRRSLGYQVRSKMMNEVAELVSEKESVERKLQRVQNDSEKLDTVNGFLRKYGINIYHYNWQKQLAEKMAGGCAVDVKRDLERIATLAQNAAEMLTSDKEDKLPDASA